MPPSKNRSSHSPSEDVPESDGDRRAARRSSSGGEPSGGSGNAAQTFLWILGGLLIGGSTIGLPNEGIWLGIKALALESVAIVLMVFVLSQGDWTPARVRAALLAPPNLAILLFLVWVGVSYATIGLELSKPGTPILAQRLNKMAQYEAMRHLGGGLLFFAVVYGLSMRRHLDRVVTLLIVAGSLASIVAFATFNESQFGKMSGAFRNSQLFGGVLCLLFPVALMAARSDMEGWRKLSAQSATVIIAAGILANGNRSAWFGTVAAMLLVAFLVQRYGQSGEQYGFQKHQLVIPFVMVLLVGGLFWWVSRSNSDVIAKSTSLQNSKNLVKDQSFQWRVGMWSKGFRMVSKKPVMGWGIGTFPVQQALFFHPYTPSRSQKAILEKGATLSENAHNTYVQIAAETGLVGLVLFLGIYGAFFATTLPAVARLRPGFRQSILIGTIGAVLAQMVAAFGTPAWEFPECSMFLWLTLALGVALAGVPERGRERSRS
jgi:O-antigen ligase